MTDQRHHLALFFSSGVSLAHWKDRGLFDREVELYRRLQREGVRVTFVTYGGPEDLELAPEIPGIEILCNQRNLPPAVYAYLLPWLHGSTLRSVDLIRTNQIYGADVARRAARAWHKPLIVRGGYMPSTLLAWRHGAESPEAHGMRRLEERVFRHASLIIMTTDAMKAEVGERVAGAESKVRVIPNFVDLERFRPDESLRDPKRVVFIGRNSPEKNIPALLEAMDPLDASLLLIGAGDGRDISWHRSVDRASVTWEPRLSNADIPSRLNGSGIYVIPSYREGHPKTLIEAMACGVAVIGTDAPGIREIIRHEETGLLCGTGAPSIRAAIERMLGDADLRRKLGHNARRYAIENFSLDRIVAMEITAQEEVLGRS